MSKDHEELDRAGIAGARVVLEMAPEVKGVIVICLVDADDESVATAMTHTKMPHRVVARALLSEAERLLTAHLNPTTYKKSDGVEIYKVEHDG